MSKICGLISDNPDVPAPALLDRMYEASWQSCYRSREVWSDGPAGLGHFSIGAVNTESSPLSTLHRKRLPFSAGRSSTTMPTVDR